MLVVTARTSDPEVADDADGQHQQDAGLHAEVAVPRRVLIGPRDVTTEVLTGERISRIASRSDVSPMALMTGIAVKPSTNMPMLKSRKSLTLEQAEKLITKGIPKDPRPAMWLTGLMCGLRHGELAGLRWPFVDVDSDEPNLTIAERALEVEDKYVGQASPKTERGNRRMALHPLLVAALIRHREEQKMLRLYEDDGFVFPTHLGEPTAATSSRLLTAS